MNFPPAAVPGSIELPTGTIESAAADFGDPRLEYEAAHKSAAVFDLAGRTQIEVGGRDRAKFLQNFCTNDIKGLAPGRACEAFITSVQGKILAYVWVSAGPQALWLSSDPDCAAKIIAHLSKYQISEDVTFTDRTGELGLLLVCGPAATEIVGGLLPAAAEMESLQVAEAEFESNAVRIRRHDLLRLPCFYLVASSEVLSVLRDRLQRAGARPAGSLAFEALRIEAGFPRYGVDISDANLAQEAGRTKQAISFTKGCYLGQEPIARIDALGHVNQLLRGLKLSGSSLPPPGSEVFSTGDGAKKVGQITSSAISYADDRPVALALLRRGFETPGQTLHVRIHDDSVAAAVFWPDD